VSTARQPRVFISRTTAGLAALADNISAILRERDIEVIVQTDLLPDWRTVPQMLQELLRKCDAVIALIGPAYGGEPEFEPARLNDKRTYGRKFSSTQWEYLVARDLKRPIFTFLVSGDDLIAPYQERSSIGEDLTQDEATARAQRQRQFIADFPMQQKELRYEYTERQKLLDFIRSIEFELTVLAGKPCNIPYTSLGTLFKGRDAFIVELRQQLTSEAPVGIRGKRTIHGMGGVGKTRAAIEYAWKHANDYNALLFISADTPEALRSNFAALCGPLVLNLPEQDQKEQAIQVEATLRWLRLRPGWFLIIDNVDTDETAEETKALLAKLITGHVVITSRISDWTGHVKSLDLDVLSDIASIEFLDERTAERRIKADTDVDTVKTLVRLLDCLALALEQAGAHISTTAISYIDYIKLWEAHRAAALAWHDEDKMKYPTSLAITYETSVAQLSEGAKKLFRILSWLAPDPIPRHLLDSRPNVADERRHLIEIERLHLARYLGDGKTFTVHRLNQEITRQQQNDAMPPDLHHALELVNSAYPYDSDDVRTWAVALPLAPHAITVGVSGADHHIPKPSAALLNQVALLFRARADYRAAEPLMRRALAVSEEADGKDHPAISIRLNNLAGLLQDTNRLAEAEPLLRRAQAIDLAYYGADHPELARDLSNIASLLQVTNRLAEAEPLMRRALAIDEAAYGKDHPTVAIRLHNLVGLLHASSRLPEAESLMRRALAINETTYGSKHPNVALNLNNLAALLQASGRLAEAEQLIRRALAIDEVAYGKDHPAVARALENLATLLRTTNRSAEAEPLMRRALAINEVTFGNDHPTVARALNNLAHLLQTTNRPAEAELLMRRALVIDEAAYGKDHPDVARDLNNLAAPLRATGRMAEAETLMRRAISINETAYGKDHPDVADVLNNLAELLKATDRLAEAESLLRRALAINETAYGSKHTNVALNLNNLGQLLQATKRLSEAEPLMRRALMIYESSFGREHPLVAVSQNNLARLLQDTNRLVDAEPLMRLALAGLQASLGGWHPQVAICLNNLASLLQATQRAAEALPLMERSVEVFLENARATGHKPLGLLGALGKYFDLLCKAGYTPTQAVEKIEKMSTRFNVTL
jgi:tetratricopeptide (TPR) repeat protein